MSETKRLSLADAEALVARALAAAGVQEAAASSTARALVGAERDGQKGHGLARVPSYVEQVRSRKVDGAARPSTRSLGPAAVVVDAGHGFAFPAIDAAIGELLRMTPQTRIAVAAIRRSHHFGQAGAHVERLAERGLIAFLFGNSPKAMAFWGGARPMMGTNPIAFAAPMAEGPPLVIDLALSVAARGRIVAAHKAGEAIPEGWALDEEGKPTTDAGAALKGSMAPLGGAKGAALALMIEVLAAAVTASNFGFEASSFLDGAGGPPEVGQVFIALDPVALSGGAYIGRMARLAEALAEERGARLPGTSRLQARARAAQEGLAIPAALHREIVALAGEAA